MKNILSYFLLIHFWNVSRALDAEVLQLAYKKTYSFSVNSTVEYIFQFYENQTTSVFPPRVTVTSRNAKGSTPLMIVSRQTEQMLSWQLPLTIESEAGDKFFNDTSRTLCYDYVRGNNKTKEPDENGTVYEPIVTVSTASKDNVEFNITVDNQEDFYLTSKAIEFAISPSKPKYFFYNFTGSKGVRDLHSDYETVILEVNSNDSVCMTVSIQNFSCPVFDSSEDVTFRGFYETVNTKGGITIPKYKFRYGFFVVFVVNDDDRKCSGSIGVTETNRTKIVRAIISPNITYDDYLYAVLLTLSFIGVFYLVFLMGFCLYSRRLDVPREMGFVPPTPSSIAPSCLHVSDNVSDELEYDHMPSLEMNREILYSKSNLFLSDLARKDPRILTQKSYLYLYNVLIIALFYGLPVIQLVVTYQTVLNNTGQQDLCYYNFLCAHPLGVLSDFNHVFSNIAYVLLGLLFMFITNARERKHTDIDFDRSYGIPQHYGFFYAMGIALIMEGILSGSYHVCPNNANFQFDLSFMYAMAILCMVKLYQNRHPDINARAYTTFGILAVVILLVLINIFEDGVGLWVIFTTLYIFMCIYISIKVYYLGCWQFDYTIFRRLYNEYTRDYEIGFITFIKPRHTARFVLLLIGNLCNFAMAILGATEQFTNRFGLFLLGIFMLNTLLYFVFYIIMKYIYKERVILISWIFLIISLMCASSAMYFFVHKNISWATTPAMSRQFNGECEFLRFYDSHDIWHFLSAIGMFFTFMVLLTLDDDLTHTHRSEINVF